MYKYILIFILFFSTINAIEITNVKISGNNRLSNETIKVYGNISIPKNYSNEELNNITKELYNTNFFKDIVVSIKDKTLFIEVEEYQIINKIIITGEDASKFKEAILENLKSKENGSFIKNNISKDIDIAKKIYASIGFNFSEVTISSEQLTAERVNLYLDVKKGNKTKIQKITFSGDKQVRDSRLRSVIVSEEYKFWKFISKNVNLTKRNIELDKRLLTNYYKSNGYYDVQILSDSIELIDDHIELNYTINAGKRYRFVKFETNVQSPFDSKLFLKLNDDYEKYIGEYYSPFKIKKLLDSLDLLIAFQNLQFVEHSINEIISDDGIEVKVNIYEGKKQTVERINIIGNSITNENVIRSELILDEGDPFSKLKLDQSIASLKSRNIFSKVVEKISEGSEKDLKVIDITVEEKPTGEISAGAGFGTNGGSLAFTVSENNFLGNGIKLITSFELSDESLKGEVQVNNPNYNYSGNALNFNIASQTDDKPESGYESSAYSAGIGTNFEQYRDIYIAPGFQLNTDKLSVHSGATSSMKKQAGTFTDLTFNYTVAADKRDRKFMPTNGYFTSFTQDIPLVADSPYIRNSFATNLYRGLSPDIIGSMKIFGTTIHGLENKDVRLSKRTKLPPNKLRGFQRGKVGPLDGKDYIGGNYATAANFAAQFPNLLPDSTKVDVGAFLDFANLWGVDYSSAVADSNKIRSTIGVNAQWTSPVGPVSLVFSQNLSKAATDKTESFSFNLGTTF
jgi:outer membrane protein insertion porin family